MIMSLRGNQRLLHTRQNLFCLRQRQPQIGDLGKAGGSIDLYQVDTICRAVAACFDQSQNPTHARSPGQKDKDRRIAPGPIPPISGQSHADLETELPDNLTYIDVWKDALVTNNKAYEAKGAALVGGRNAPASDAHIVVRGATRTIVLTTLDTEGGCKPPEFSYPSDVTIKMCPTRLVVFEGAIATTRELPASCYLEIDPKSSPTPNDAASYAAFDTITKTIKIGLIVNHRAIDECARFIPTAP